MKKSTVEAKITRWEAQARRGTPQALPERLKIYGWMRRVLNENTWATMRRPVQTHLNTITNQIADLRNKQALEGLDQAEREHLHDLQAEKRMIDEFEDLITPTCIQAELNQR